MEKCAKTVQSGLCVQEGVSASGGRKAVCPCRPVSTQGSAYLRGSAEWGRGGEESGASPAAGLRREEQPQWQSHWEA